MRQSRQGSSIIAAEKGKYPRCDRRKEHQKESLNLVCLSANCKARGLICIQCKSSGDHAGHNIQPLKTFITKLQQSLKKIQLTRVPQPQQPKSQPPQNERSLLQKLQDQHTQMLSLLKIQIGQISQKVRKCEEDVLRQYDRMRQKVYTQFQKENIIGKVLVQVQRWLGQGGREEGELKIGVAKLLALVRVQKSQVSVVNQAEKELNVYLLSSKTFKNNMLVWERETSNIITDIFKSKPDYQVREALVRPTTAVDSSSKGVALTFSPQFKTQSVVLDKEQKIAKVKDDKNGKIVLLNQSILQQKNTIVRFKVTGQIGTSAIQFGLCNKAQISQKNYKFEKSNANHGLYVSSSNGFVYSSGDHAANNSKGHLSFKSGDEIVVEVDSKESKLVVKKKSDGKLVEVGLKHIGEADWKDLYLCASMNSVGDKVQLLG